MDPPSSAHPSQLSDILSSNSDPSDHILTSTCSFRTPRESSLHTDSLLNNSCAINMDALYRVQKERDSSSGPSLSNGQCSLSGDFLQQKYKETLELPTPTWAVEYEQGHLNELNLPNEDSGSTKIPGYDQPKFSPKSPSVAFRFWEILVRVPGGKMSLNVLVKTLKEWKSNFAKTEDQTFRSALTRNCCFINEAIPNSTKRGTWRIGTLAEAREKEKAQQQKRLLSDPGTETSAEPRSKKVKKEATTPTKLPSPSSSDNETTKAHSPVTSDTRLTIETAAQQTAHISLPLTPSPESKIKAQRAARTSLPSRPSPTGQTTSQHAAWKPVPSTPSKPVPSTPSPESKTTAQSKARPPLPLKPSPTGPTTSQSTTRTKLPSSPSPCRDTTAHDTARTELPSNSNTTAGRPITAGNRPRCPRKQKLQKKNPIPQTAGKDDLKELYPAKVPIDTSYLYVQPPPEPNEYLHVTERDTSKDNLIEGGCPLFSTGCICVSCRIERGYGAQSTNWVIPC